LLPILCSLAISCLLICLSGERGIKTTIKLVSLCYAVLAFFQYADPVTDLYTAYSYIDMTKIYGWSFLTNSSVSEGYFSGKFVLQLYFYLMSLLPFKNLYSAIPTFLIYYLNLKVAHKAAGHFKLSYINTRFLLCFVMIILDFYALSNGVRNYWSFAVFLYALYADLFEGKTKLCWIGYIIAIGIHPATVVLLVIRLLCYIRSVYIKVVILAVMALWSNLIELAVAILSAFTSVPIIRLIVSKLLGYTSYGNNTNFSADNFNASSSYMMMHGFRTIFLVVMLLVIIQLLNKKKNTSDYTMVGFYLLMFGLGATAATVATNVLTRYSVAMTMMTPAILSEAHQEDIKRYTLVVGKIRINWVGMAMCACLMLFNYYYLLVEYYHYQFVLTLY